MRRVDKLGRIVIPQELREKYGLTEGAGIDFIDNGDGVTVVLSEGSCRICGAMLKKNSTLPLCDECTERIVKSYGSNKK